MKTRSFPRFQRFYKEKGTSECWTWEGGCSSRGYGAFNKDGVIMAAHRASYEFFKGEIPVGMNVCHSCDNIICVNPDHLWLGTQLENMQDMIRKGRRASAKGKNNPNCKLSKSDVEAIRDSRRRGDPVRAIAGEFGVTKTHVYRLCEQL